MQPKSSKTGWWKNLLNLAGLVALLVLLTPGWSGAIIRSVTDLVVDGGDTLIVPPSITYDNETIGDTGQGTLWHYPGNNTVNDNLVLGKTTTGSGAYKLYGGSLSVHNSVFIGYDGTGSFSQIYGTNTVDEELFLGRSSGSKGTYYLYKGNLLVGGEENIGWIGMGDFTQIGGTHTVLEDLRIGVLGSAMGTYYLKFGNLSASDETIGGGSTGSFTQIGGSHTVNNDLTLGNLASGSGTYKQYGGLLQVGQYEIVGNSGTGSYSQIGGKHTVGSTLYIGFESSGSGTYHLYNGNLSSVFDFIGYDGTGNFIQGGGSHDVSSLQVGVGFTSDGTYLLKFGHLTAGSEFIGYAGPGNFTQIGGANKVTDTLIIGFSAGSSGTYNMIGGHLRAPQEFIGYGLLSFLDVSIGSFNQFGGDHVVESDLSLGFRSGGRGTYALSAGNLSVGGNEYVGGSGIGVFTQSGGKHTVANTLTLAMDPGSTGTYNLQGGKLTAGTIQINSPASGGGSGTFNVMSTITTVTGDVVNDGTVKTTNASVTWNGNFTNNGAYISDPAKQTFEGDLEVGADGYLVGASQDLFVIKGDFINQSTNTTDWDTAAATLKFATAGWWDRKHDFYIPGADNGPSDPNEFPWGTLNIAGQIVHLFDGNTDNNGTAQYVGGLIGAQVNWFTKVVYNIFNDTGAEINIYYDPDLLVNFYLGGGTYSFAGGLGQLIPDPISTPLPPSVLLLGSGLLGVGLLGWRRKRS